MKYDKCHKKGYPNRSIAKKAMKKLNDRLGRSLTDVYYCEICDIWHTTSMDKKASRNITRKNKAK